MSKKLIPGEYDCVSRQSLNPARLRRAHEIPCDAATAYFLIAVMHEHAMTGHPMPKVELRKPRVGKIGARGWGGRTVAKDDKGHFTGYRGYVSLPRDPMTPGQSPYGKLRIGLVCHEYAHAVEMLRFGKSDHGARFTVILDELLFFTEQYWSTQVSKAAGAE